jgi:hypothetical protein
MTPDPYVASGGPSPSQPGSWNRYADVLGDPTLFVDPYGLDVYLFMTGYGPLYCRASTINSDPGNLMSGMGDASYNSNQVVVNAGLAQVQANVNGQTVTINTGSQVTTSSPAIDNGQATYVLDNGLTTPTAAVPSPQPVPDPCIAVANMAYDAAMAALSNTPSPPTGGSAAVPTVTGVPIPVLITAIPSAPGLITILPPGPVSVMQSTGYRVLVKIPSQGTSNTSAEFNPQPMNDWAKQAATAAFNAAVAQCP